MKDDLKNLSPKEIELFFWQSQLVLLLPGIAGLWFFYLRKGYTLNNFYSITNINEIFIIGTIVALIGVIIQVTAWKIFSLDAFDDGGINKLMLSLPMTTIIPMFIFGAFVEELLVRGVVQTGVVYYLGEILGLIFTSILFTCMHVRYLKKPVLISGVFILSIILGSSYALTDSLWTSTWAHFIYNTGSAYLAKKYYLPKLEK